MDRLGSCRFLPAKFPGVFFRYSPPSGVLFIHREAKIPGGIRRLAPAGEQRGWYAKIAGLAALGGKKDLPILSPDYSSGCPS
jgi:hypothetical protein